MKTSRFALTYGLVLACLSPAVLATERFVSLTGGHVPPFINWADAATNIQDAIDASIDGDVIWVTNGVYATGGKVMAGDLTNRVALDKALTVRSVNGPFVTVIQGTGATNGLLAVRCAWLTNGATLVGFTMERGATRGGGATDVVSGGGAWCTSNAIVANCVIRSNTAGTYGGGTYQGVLNNCLVTGNNASVAGGGTLNSVLNNCTVVYNSNSGVHQSLPNRARAANCIVYFNTPANYQGGVPFSYSCTTPLPSGTGNISAAPQLLTDGFHLANASPCRGAGTNLVSGTDIDGQSWANPPSIGCDEWQPAPLIYGQPKLQLTSDPVGFIVAATVVGQEPFACWWTRDGSPIENDGHYSSAHTTNLVASGVGSIDGGSYQVVVSNAFGVATSAVVQLVVHYVNVAGVGSVPPYLSWSSAATNIQDAIDASLPGEIVLVTNGIYGNGGKVMGGDLTNRVALDKALLLQSANGPAVTVIQGARDPATNGPLAVRCSWLASGAIMSGFTLTQGATRAAPNTNSQGGGVWGASSNAVVANCVIATNSASDRGGGAYAATLNNCTVIGNTAGGIPAAAGYGGGVDHCNLKNCILSGNFAANYGGGTASGVLKNCAVTTNWARYNGGGAYSATLINCAVTGNLVGDSSYGYGGGVANATLINSIVYGNATVLTDAGHSPSSNSYSSAFSFSCSAPLPSGPGNIALNPQLLGDGVHLSQVSPCRGTGTNVVVGSDIDGQPWVNPPSIGCDEWWSAPVIVTQPATRLYGSPLSLKVGGVLVAGQEPFALAWLKDGNPLNDGSHINGAHTTDLTINGFGPSDAGGYQLVASNAFGVATSAVAQVVVHCADAASASPARPYSDWSTAAPNIQDAIDVAAPGEIVLVTNGVYAAGGKVMAGDLTNRVALDKALTVISVNGSPATVIQGAWDPATTNGPLAVRCAWLTSGATLSGFTLQSGATRAFTGAFGANAESGGGAWCASTNGIVSNCVLTNNFAIYGGGIAYGTLNNSLVIRNVARYGGGAYSAWLNNCTVVNNYLTPYYYQGAGTYDGITRNSIVVGNSDSYPNGFNEYNYAAFSGAAQYSYSYTAPPPPSYSIMPSGISNINAFNVSAQFVGGFNHIATTSPCRGKGSSLYATGTDLDGEPWATPPSIGCDEVVEANLVGPLTVAIVAPRTNVLVNHFASFGAQITGRLARVEWSFGDGSPATSSSSHMWTNVDDYTLTLTAFNTDNPGGVSTNLLVHVLSPNQPLLQSVAMTTNGFQFTFPGQESVQYWVEMATNLTPPVAWQTLQNIFYSTGGVHQITDSVVTNATRFYRVKAR